MWVILAYYLTLWQNQNQQSCDKIHVSAAQLLIQRKRDGPVGIWVTVRLLNSTMLDLRLMLLWFLERGSEEGQVGRITMEHRKIGEGMIDIFAILITVTILRVCTFNKSNPIKQYLNLYNLLYVNSSSKELF